VKQSITLLLHTCTYYLRNTKYDNVFRLAVESQEWTGPIPFTVTSISKELESKSFSAPGLIIAVNPGFNVEEWIDLPRIRRGSVAPIIVVNGNLDRVCCDILTYMHHS
jgi:hypothetical protein